MGRKREFDQARALEKATHLFWARGYGATPVRDLLKAMGIRESSFYHLYGSKRKLFLACMKHYNETVTRARLDAIAHAPTVREGLRIFFKQRLDELTDSQTPRVCLMARSLSPDVMQERQLNAYVRTEMSNFEQSLTRRLQQAKDTGELPSDFSAGVAAQIIFTYLQGYYRVVQILKTREELWREIEGLLTKLGL
ncbi:MAG: TetR/AcrR family transcriptional regulator [Verrucomicrobiota bacterium]|jgi:TetR/AcrR family transcriptional repressor of nem operon